MRTLWTWFIGAGMILAALLALLFVSKAPMAPTYNPFDGDYARPNPAPQVMQPVGYNVQAVQQRTFATPVVATTAPVYAQPVAVVQPTTAVIQTPMVAQTAVIQTPMVAQTATIQSPMIAQTTQVIPPRQGFPVNTRLI